MPFRIEGEEIQTNGDVKELLDKIRRDPRTTNPRIRVIDQIAHMQTRNGGFPVFMHHETLDPVQAWNEREQDALEQAGFHQGYKNREYPLYLHRRNMHPKFAKSPQDMVRIQQMTPDAQRIEMATINENDFIESVLVKNAAEEQKLLAQKPNKATGTGPWVRKVTDIERFPDGPEEDPAVTIARMEGELAALREQQEGKRGPGRPRKEDAA